MPGPLPKERNARERDEKKHAYPQTHLGSDPVKDHPGRSMLKTQSKKWRGLHADTRAWWRDVLDSPQAGQFGQTGWRRLYMVVLPTVERFNREEAKGDEADVGKLVKLAQTLQAHEREFGLTPEARLKLRWTLRPPAAAQSAQQEDDAPKPKRPKRDTRDPRATMLRAVGD